MCPHLSFFFKDLLHCLPYSWIQFPPLAIIPESLLFQEELYAFLTGATGSVTLLGGHLDPRHPRAKAELEVGAGQRAAQALTARGLAGPGLSS